MRRWKSAQKAEKVIKYDEIICRYDCVLPAKGRRNYQCMEGTAYKDAQGQDGCEERVVPKYLF